MAQSSGLTWVLLAGAAYIAYEYLFSTPAVASTPASIPPATTPATPVGPAVSYVPPSLTTQLQTLAGPGVTTLDADQWNYYYTTAPPQGLGQTGPANFTIIFFPNGRPSDPSQNPQMTAAQFVAAIGNPGLSGLNGRGWARAIPVPAMQARGFGQFTLGDLRRAGGR
jgi:hypothetical protein